MKTDSNNTRRRLSAAEAKKLTAAFLDGSTTLEQESLLYDYYSRGPVAPELEEYREMMSWYSAGLKLDTPSPEIKPKAYSFKSIARIIAPLAAAVALIISLTVMSIPSSEPMQANIYAEYEGSYIIRNGKKITDLQQILPSILKAEQTCRSFDLMVAEQEAAANEIVRQALIEHYGSEVVLKYLPEEMYN